MEAAVGDVTYGMASVLLRLEGLGSGSCVTNVLVCVISVGCTNDGVEEV